MNKPDKFLHVTGQGKPLIKALKLIRERSNTGTSECKDDGYDLACEILDIAEDALKAIGDEYDISQSDADEVSNTPEIPDSSLDADNECKNPDKSNCKYCSRKYHSVCKVIENNDLADVSDTDAVEILDTTSRENEFDSIAGQVGMLKGRPVTDEEWVEGIPPRDSVIEVYGSVYRSDEMKWVKAIAYAIVDNRVLAASTTHAGTCVFYTKSEIRPIRTPAQIAEEERNNQIEVIYEITTSLRNKHGDRAVAEYIRDGRLNRYIAQGEGNE